MIIHSLEIRHAGAIEALNLSDIPSPGAVVIEGENEAGKTTIMKMVQHALEKRESSKSKEVRELQPQGRDEGPEITLELSIGAHRLRVFKRWIKQPRAEVTVLDGPHKGQRWSGSEAQNRLDEMRKEAGEKELFDALFVTQDSLGEQLKAAGIPSLTSMLEGRSGDAAEAVEEDVALLKEVGDLYRATFTEKGSLRSNSQLSRANSALEDAQQRFDAATRERADLQERVARIQKAEPKIVEWTRKEPELVQDLESKEAAFREVEKLEQQRHTIDARKLDATELLANARKEVTSRQEQLAEAERLEAVLATQREQCEQHEAQAEEEAQRVAEINAALESAREKAHELQESIDTAARIVRLQQAQEELDELQRTNEQLQELHQQRETHRAVPNVTQAMLDRAQEASAELRRCTAVHESQSPTLRIAAHAGREISVDGVPTALEHDITLSVTKPLSVAIDGVELEVRPGAGVEDSAEALERAERGLAEALEATPATDVAQLRELRAQREAAEAALQELQLNEATLLAGRDAEAIAAKITELALSLEQAELPQTFIDPREELQAQLDAARAEESTLLERREAVQSRPAQRAAEEAKVHVESTKAQLERVRSALAAAAENATLEQLEALVAEREQALAALEEEVLRAADSVERAGGTQVRSHYEAARAALDNLRGDLQRKRAFVEHEQAEVDAKAGVEEEFRLADQDLHSARTRQQVLQREADAIALLHQVLLKHRNEAREQYARPLGEAMAKLAPHVFGEDVTFSFDDSLRVTARNSVSGQFPVEQLSAGAKEQLGLLVRLALAELVGDEHTAIFIDDPLGSSDPERLTQLNGLIGELAGTRQIILTTCYPERFAKVPGKSTFDLAELAKYHLRGV